MPNIVLFWVVLFLVAPPTYSQNSCPPSFTFNNNNNQCTYKVNYDNPTKCSELVFVSCDVKVQSTHPLTFSSKDICDNYCCTNAQDDNFVCRKNSSSISMNTIIIILSVTLAVFILIACICKFREHCCWESCFSFNCFNRNNAVNNSNHLENIQMINTNETQMDLDNFNSREWHEEQDDLGNLECSVCLTQGSNFMLPCRHLFHQKCILECMKYRFECILCRRKDLFSYRIYCRQCFRYYKKVMYYDLSKLKDEESLACNECMNKVLNPQITQC